MTLETSISIIYIYIFIYIYVIIYIYVYGVGSKIVVIIMFHHVVWIMFREYMGTHDNYCRWDVLGIPKLKLNSNCMYMI